MGTIPFDDLEILNKLATMTTPEIMSDGRRLANSCSTGNIGLALSVVELRLGKQPTNSDEKLVRMAKAVVSWGKQVRS